MEETQKETRQKQREFLVLVMEACKTGDETELTEWWHEHFPGYKLSLIGPDCTGGDMKKKLIVKYDGFHEEMEEELRALLERYGWRCWASGRNLETGVRDIACEREDGTNGG